MIGRKVLILTGQEPDLAYFVKIAFAYNTDDDIESIRVTEVDKEIESILFTYDADRNLIERRVFEEGELCIKEVIIYDDKGHIIDVIESENNL